MKYVFIEEMSGTSKAGNPYHLLKLADPKTFENHVIGYDPLYIQKPAYNRGEQVEISGELRTPFNDTKFVATSIKKAV